MARQKGQRKMNASATPIHPCRSILQLLPMEDKKLTKALALPIWLRGNPHARQRNYERCPTEAQLPQQVCHVCVRCYFTCLNMLSLLEESSPAPPAPPSMWETFLSRRQELLQEAVKDSVRTGVFHDVDIYAYHKRGQASRSACVPTTFHARTSFLEAASPILRGMCSSFEFQHR